MKKAALPLCILFLILALVGSGVVLYNHGKVNAGCAVIPMVFVLISLAFYRKRE
ncbi:MAG: hypothetical protein HDQ99_18915 [Lachnospiraceae bacterium]|nr:hypothetical protein [Lachnospiraceae bacterium]